MKAWNNHPIFAHWHPLDTLQRDFDARLASYEYACALFGINPYVSHTKRKIKNVFHQDIARLLCVPVEPSTEGYWKYVYTDGKPDLALFQQIWDFYTAFRDIQQFYHLLGTRGRKAWKRYLAERGCEQ